MRRLQARLTEVAVGRELEAIARGKPVPESVREIRALVAERVEGREGGIDDEDGTCSATIKNFAVKKLGVEAQRSPAWWAEHTVIRLVVTHLNEHGARVLFAMPGRGIDLVAKTPEQAERQLAFARERWPEGAYEVREVRFWRDANGSPGDPVHTLVEETEKPRAFDRATAVRTTLRDILRKALNLVDRGDVVIMRAGSDYQVRLSGRGLARVEMRYVDDERHVGNFRPACPWFTFEGFSVEAALADDWEIVDAPTPEDA